MDTSTIVSSRSVAGPIGKQIDGMVTAVRLQRQHTNYITPERDYYLWHIALATTHHHNHVEPVLVTVHSVDSLQAETDVHQAAVAETVVVLTSTQVSLLTKL